MTQSSDALLQQLADEAGLLAAWRDAHGRDQRVAVESLRGVLEALALPCASEAQCRESLAALRAENAPSASPPLVIVKQGSPVVMRRSGSPHYRLQLEDGTFIMGTARDLDGGHVAIHGINRPGYHTLEMGRVRTTIAIVPRRAPSVEDVVGHEHAWVIGAQVYSLQRDAAPAQTGGTIRASELPGWHAGGDYTALATLARQAAEHGAAGLAISPVHAMFSADPQRYSPYAPSSRLFLNAMYADPAAVLGADRAAELSAGDRPELLDAKGLLNWPAIQAQRLEVFRTLYERFRDGQADQLVQDFEAFRQEGGRALADHACYEALHAHHATVLGAGHGWQDWPAEFRDPSGSAVMEFARRHAHEVEFHAFLQWLAARNLAQTHCAAREAGMPIGLLADMAVGTDPRGSHAWCRQGQLMSGVSVGAPPDLFQPQGQNWGLSAFSPRALYLHGFQGFIETLRAVLAHAGGVRVDHVLGLARMWLVPDGAAPSDGVYVRYPRDELMDLLVLEAWRHRAVAVGENLGTVPAGFNESLETRGVYGMNVLWFEQQEDDAGQKTFRPPQVWPSQSMAMVTTHDLPTVSGWWSGRDIEWQQRIGHSTAEEASQQHAERTEQKTALWQALQDARLAEGGAGVPEEPPMAAVLAYVAGALAELFSVSLEDLLGRVDQPNVPWSGPQDAPEAPPNWRQVLSPGVEQLLTGKQVVDVMRTINCVREEQYRAGSPKP